MKWLITCLSVALVVLSVGEPAQAGCFDGGQAVVLSQRAVPFSVRNRALLQLPLQPRGVAQTVRLRPRVVGNRLIQPVAVERVVVPSRSARVGCGRAGLRQQLRAQPVIAQPVVVQPVIGVRRGFSLDLPFFSLRTDF